MATGNITRPHSAQVRSGRPSKPPLSPERTFATIPALNSPRLRYAQPPLLSASIVSLLSSATLRKAPRVVHYAPTRVPPVGDPCGHFASLVPFATLTVLRSVGRGSRPSPKAERCSIYYRLWTAINFFGRSLIKKIETNTKEILKLQKLLRSRGIT